MESRFTWSQSFRGVQDLDTSITVLLSNTRLEDLP